MSASLVVFDLDGTLIDTAHDLVASLNHTIGLEGLAPVGYGDLTPKTGGARLLCVMLAVVGVTFTAIITSLALNAGRVAMERHPALKERWLRKDQL